MGTTSQNTTPDLSATMRIFPVITVFRDGQQIAEVSLDKRNIRIGRAPENEICLDDIGVSRHHAQIVTVLGESVVEDLDSRNGTFVNNKWIRTRQLSPGDAIVVAGYRLVYQYVPGESADEVGDLLRRWRRGVEPRGDGCCSACGQPLPKAPAADDSNTVLL
jgi:pSer/pThr/pTyr-binding forkhead associated (FHA) protein